MNSTFRVLALSSIGTVLVPCPGCSTEVSAETAPAGASVGVSTAALIVEGTTCGSCWIAVRVALKNLDGVRDARMRAKEKRAVVEYDPSKVTPQRMIDAVNELGYRARFAPKEVTR